MEINSYLAAHRSGRYDFEDSLDEFHTIFGAAINDRSRESIELRMKLVQEEAAEVHEEFVKLAYGDDGSYPRLAKELADLLYVVFGTGIALGIDVTEAFARVHESNMSKLDDDGNVLYREDGKVLKGPNYSPPDMEGFDPELNRRVVYPLGSEKNG